MVTQEFCPSLDSWFDPTSEERAANRRMFLSLKGRVGRQTYWQFAVAPAVVFLALTVRFNLPDRMSPFGFTMCGLLLSWCVFAISVKRRHDRGRSGWFLLVKLIPFVGAIWVLLEHGVMPSVDDD